MQQSILKSILFVLTTGFALVGCGGGGGGGASSSGSTSTASNVNTVPPVNVPLPTTTISGVYDGSNNAGQPVTAILQNDGSYFIVYSGSSAPHSAVGAAVGMGVLSGTGFSSTSGNNLTLTGSGKQAADPVTVTATYVDKTTFNGSVTFTSSSQTSVFTSSYNSAYETVPSLTTLAGKYVGTIATKDLREEKITLTLSADGTLTGVLPCGCSITSKLVVRPGSGVLDATFAFTGGDHPLADKSLAGNVYFDAQTNKLYIAGTLTGSTDKALFVGVKS